MKYFLDSRWWIYKYRQLRIHLYHLYISKTLSTIQRVRIEPVSLSHDQGHQRLLVIDEEDIFTQSRNPNFTRYISSATNEFLEELVFKWASTVEIPCKYLHKKFLLIQKITDKWSSNYGQAVSRKVNSYRALKQKRRWWLAHVN